MACLQNSVKDTFEEEQDKVTLRAPLLAPQDDAGDCFDWRGRPAVDASLDLGGWKCSSCVIGVYGLSWLASYGILLNLVMYLVQVCGQSNAAAATAVTNLSGTMLISSFLGALLSDGRLGRLWVSLTFSGLQMLFSVLTSIATIVISRGSATGGAYSFFFVSLYMLGISIGPGIPSVCTLGADQLSSIEAKVKYFRMMAISASVGQLLAATVVTYMDNAGMWVWGFSVCSAASVTTLAVLAGMTRRFRQYKTAGDPFLRNMQVLVAACRKRSLTVPKDSSLLHECPHHLSAIPGSHKLPHTGSLSFLDKAAVLGSPEKSGPWRLCTVSQVEELKSVLRVIPVGIMITFVAATSAQVSTLFEEQAYEMNREVATWLVVPPASLNIFSFGSAILTGIVISAGESRLPCRWLIGCRKRRHAQKVTSLQLLGLAFISSIMAMVIAALVESLRLYAAQEGALLSVLWLVPQTVFVGIATNLVMAGGLDFFYNEVSDSMRTVGSSILSIFFGAGNYLSSILVALVTAITTQGGGPGWIASNLNEGHLDYFYWLLASCLAFTFGVYLIYTHSYIYSRGTDIDDK
eukprot:c19785_g1_i1 orf=191-1921(+)